MSALLAFIPGRVLLYGVAIVIMLGAITYTYHHIEQGGYDRRISEEDKIVRSKVDAATQADDSARLCAADPSCRMRPDQYLRK